MESGVGTAHTGGRKGAFSTVEGGLGAGLGLCAVGFLQAPVLSRPWPWPEHRMHSELGRRGTLTSI